MPSAAAAGGAGPRAAASEIERVRFYGQAAPRGVVVRAASGEVVARRTCELSPVLLTRAAPSKAAAGAIDVHQLDS